MIVRYKEEGWEIITQRAHGLLAFQIGLRWKDKNLFGRWPELMLAIAEHDDAEVELDGENLLTANGGPLNYEMKDFNLANCIRLAELSVTKSSYIALLTSMHMQFLYQKDISTDSKAKKFLQDEKKKIARLRKQLKITDNDASVDYSLLEWCDAISLLLCRGDLQPEHREVEISQGPDKRKYVVKELAEGILHVRPWPFDKKEFKVSIEYRVLKELSFNSTDQFRKAFYKAKISERNWTITSRQR